MPASNPTCSRCGHTLYQHSTGECDLLGCACKGYVASGVHVEEFSDWWGVTIALLSLAVFFLAGLCVGLLL